MNKNLIILIIYVFFFSCKTDSVNYDTGEEVNSKSDTILDETLIDSFFV